jgi:hypothetical protein
MAARRDDSIDACQFDNSLLRLLAGSVVTEHKHGVTMDLDWLRARAGAYAPRSPDERLRIRSALQHAFHVIAAQGVTTASILPLLASSDPIILPLNMLHPCTSAHRINAFSSKDTSRLQAIKDIERDVIVVNGETLRGSDAGYHGILMALRRCIATCENNLVASAAISPEDLHSLAMQLLQYGNRTVSGGDGFEAASLLLTPSVGSKLHQFVTCTTSRTNTNPESIQDNEWGWNEDSSPPIPKVSPTADFKPVNTGIMLVPDSYAAFPINVVVDVGPFVPSESTADTTCAAWLFGVRAHVSATTVYKVLEEGAHDTQLRINATYNAHLGWTPARIHSRVNIELLQGMVDVEDDIDEHLLRSIVYARSEAEAVDAAASVASSSPLQLPAQMFHCAPGGYVAVSANVVRADGGKSSGGP